MIANIALTIRILDRDIATKEDCARFSNPSDAAYPILARVLAARRDNLKVTVAALERRLVEKGALLVEEFDNT
jgi:hypothetical protein